MADKHALSKENVYSSKIWDSINIYKTPQVIKDFDACRNKHLCADWAGALYMKEVSEPAFAREIMDHLFPYYKSAQSLGYTIWDYI